MKPQQSNSTVPPQPTPIPPATHSNKLLKILLVIFAVILIVILFIFWFGPCRIFRCNTNDILLDVKITPIQYPSPTPNETGEWKTYRNEKYGFLVKHPQTIYPKEYFGNDTYLSLISFGDPAEKTDIWFSIEVSDRTIDEEVDQFKAASGHALVKLIDETSFEVDKQKGVRLDFVPENESIGDPTSHIVTNNGKHTFLLNTRTSDVNQILSTFRFVEEEKIVKEYEFYEVGNYSGTIKGTLTYPSETILPGEIIAKNIETSELYIKKYPGVDKVGQAYSINVPPGKYHIKFEVPNPWNEPPNDKQTLFYTEYSRCFRNLECEKEKHNLITIEITEGSVTENVVISDLGYDESNNIF